MNERSWLVACTDPFGRERSVSVLVEQDRILVVPPPGQAAVLSAAELDHLHRALNAAAEGTAEPAHH